MPLGCVFNCILTPSCAAQGLQAPVENLGPVLSLNKLWNAPGRVVNLSPLQTICPNSHLPSVGSHRALGVLHSPTLWHKGTIGPLYLDQEQAASSVQLCTQGWKKKSTKYRPLDNLFVLRVFKTHKQTPAGYQWSALCNNHANLKSILCGYHLKTVWWVTPHRWPWQGSHSLHP